MRRYLTRPQVAVGVALICFGMALLIPTASAWQPAQLSVSGHGCGAASVKATNPEGQTATVRGGNLWSNGTTIPAHGSISKIVTTSGTYGVVVNYPGDQTLRSASISVHITECPPPTTTTQPPTTTTTRPSTTTTAPSTTTTEPTPTTTQPCLTDGQHTDCGQRPPGEAQPATATPAAPAFTG